MTAKKTLEDLTAEFAANVVAQSEALREGNAGNRYAKKYIAAFAELRASGDEDRSALLPLLDHPRPDVRSTAAAFLLRYNTPAAMRVLREVARLPGFQGFAASECNGMRS
jgi:hypothetical protein